MPQLTCYLVYNVLIIDHADQFAGEQNGMVRSKVSYVIMPHDAPGPWETTPQVKTFLPWNTHFCNPEEDENGCEVEEEEEEEEEEEDN